MKKQLQGIAIILFSILLTIGFHSIGWDYVFDLSLEWTHIFMLLGVVGIIFVFRTEKK